MPYRKIIEILGVRSIDMMDPFEGNCVRPGEDLVKPEGLSTSVSVRSFLAMDPDNFKDDQRFYGPLPDLRLLLYTMER